MLYFQTAKKIEKLIDTHINDFDIELAQTKEPVKFEDRLNLSYKSYHVGDSWGELFYCAWLKLSTKINYDQSIEYYLKLDLNCEALLFNQSGVPVKGFTNGSSAFGVLGHLGPAAKRYYKLNDFIAEDGTIEIWVEAGMNDLFGNVKKNGKIETVSVVVRDLQIRDLYFDFKALNQVLYVAYRDDRINFKKYKKVLGKVKTLVNKRKNDWVSDSLEITKSLLDTESNIDHYVSSIGHAHLDLAWLWPIRETKRKGARTFANILRLIEEYDDFYFGASQPQLFLWMKEEYPELYEEIREQVARGRIEVQGGMWVEADTNLSGEEALVRQMLYGIKFFDKEFGLRVKSLWLPDVFGYSGNMPQIIKKSGMDYFMTIKISWNDTNKFPHHTFNWHGIDNTSVLAHMPPEGQYNSPADAIHLRKSYNNYNEKALDNKTLNLFGVGNGGGGPSDYHVESIRRLNNLSPLPKVKIEPSYKFFEKLNKKKESFPSYHGELYLEKHRGTYTSQGRVKYFNRKLEQKLKTVETLLMQLELSQKYASQIEKIWKEVLLYQFHDILPGSSIKRVYDECLARYEQLDKELDQIVIETIYDEKSEISCYNPLLEEVEVNKYDEDKLYTFKIKPMSNVVIDKAEYKKEVIDNNNFLENQFIRVEFNKNGCITSIFDKELKKEILKFKGNNLKVYKDIANAWDIFKHYKKIPNSKMKLVDVKCFKYGATYQRVQFFKYRKSTLAQTITLKEHSRLLDFDLNVEWQELSHMLRVDYPLSINQSEAIFDIQFGHIKRKTTNNNKFEKAQYEVSGHNWVDINNGDWGVGLLSDCKYGFNTKNNVLDLNLIKSTNRPAKQGDIGNHSIKYALYCHLGDEVDSCIDSVAMKYNAYLPITNSNREITKPLFTLTNNSITYSTVKKSEEDDSMIIRLYERDGRKNETEIIFDESVILYETNMVEENPVLITSNKLSFTPFEVKTVKVKRSL